MNYLAFMSEVHLDGVQQLILRQILRAESGKCRSRRHIIWRRIRFSSRIRSLCFEMGQKVLKVLRELLMQVKGRIRMLTVDAAFHVF